MINDELLNSSSFAVFREVCVFFDAAEEKETRRILYVLKITEKFWKRENEKSIKIERKDLSSGFETLLWGNLNKLTKKDFQKITKITTGSRAQVKELGRLPNQN